MTVPSISADDPGALYAFANNTLLVAAAALDDAEWDGTNLGESFPRRFVYPGKPPWDSCGQLACWLTRGFTGPQGTEQFTTAPAASGEYGFHSVAFSIEAVTCVAVQTGKVPPSPEQVSRDAGFLYSVLWALYVGLTKAVTAKLLTPPAGRALVMPIDPSGERGGYASVTVGLSIQL